MKTLHKFVVACQLFAVCVWAQPQPNRNVAIFVYEGVELLDFGGPGEVFAATQGFNVYTVAASGEALTSQRFLKITPAYTIHNCPQPDIVVLPGGATAKAAENEDVVKWVRDGI